MAYAQAHRLALPSEASSSRDPTGKPKLSFVVDPTKLNPAFEAYKLIQDDSASLAARSYSLPSRPPLLVDLYQSRVDTARRQEKLTFTGLGYKQTKERALHQILVPSLGHRQVDEPFAGYIDANRFVVLLTYDAAKDRIVGHPVLRLDHEVQPGTHGEEALPSLASLSATEWIASSGTQIILLKLHRIKLGDSGVVRWTSGTERRWKIPFGDKSMRGATVKTCTRVSGKVRVLVQITKSVSATGSGKGSEAMQGLGFQRGALQQTEDSNNTRSIATSTVFEVRLLEVDESRAIPSPDTSDPTAAGTPTAELLWTVQSEEPLITAELGEQESLLGAEAPFTAMEEGSSQSIVPTELHGGAQPSDAPPAPYSRNTPRARRRAPHFSWAQTGDTVTIAFMLPSWINKSHVRAHFSLGALSLSFTQEALTLLNAPDSSAKITEIDTQGTTPAAVGPEQQDDLTHAARMIASGRYVSRPTWAEIDPAGSLWTVEKARGMSLLTLHLEKRHEGTRWMQVFADRTSTRSDARSRHLADTEHGDKSRTQLSFQQARTELERVAGGDTLFSKHLQEEEQDEAEDNEDDVPETMDPSELLSMLEGMQKYTVDEEAPQQGNGYGLDRTGFHASQAHGQSGGTSLSLDQPSLLKDSLEEEDANVGRNFVVTSITHYTADEPKVRTANNGVATLLATSLPADSRGEAALVIQHDLDGAIFSSCSPLDRGWKHVSTMPALSFVLASKRDAQRVHLHKRQGAREQEGAYTVLAFESAPQVTGSGSGASSTTAAGAGNLFVYYSAGSAGASAKHAPSRVIRLGTTQASNDADSNSGALLGVCSVALGRAGESDAVEDTLVCLCEHRLLLLRGLFAPC